MIGKEEYMMIHSTVTQEILKREILVGSFLKQIMFKYVFLQVFLVCLTHFVQGQKKTKS